MFSAARRKQVAWLLLLALAAVACGGNPDPATSQSGQVDVGASVSAAAAELNAGLLEPSDDVRDFDVLDVTDGSVSSLREAVVGDRPVLLWFWAPH